MGEAVLYIAEHEGEHPSLWSNVDEAERWIHGLINRDHPGCGPWDWHEIDMTSVRQLVWLDPDTGRPLAKGGSYITPVVVDAERDFSERRQTADADA
jgi:hypothetical protein